VIGRSERYSQGMSFFPNSIIHLSPVEGFGKGKMPRKPEWRGSRPDSVAAGSMRAREKENDGERSWVMGDRRGGTESEVGRGVPAEPHRSWVHEFQALGFLPIPDQCPSVCISGSTPPCPKAGRGVPAEPRLTRRVRPAPPLRSRLPDFHIPLQSSEERVVSSEHPDASVS
jgi:hypothetical protein